MWLVANAVVSPHRKAVRATTRLSYAGRSHQPAYLLMEMSLSNTNLAKLRVGKQKETLPENPVEVRPVLRHHEFPNGFSSG